MAFNQINKLAWIVKTIHKARWITFEELNEKWMENRDMSGGEELLKRTFHKWKFAIWDTFGLDVQCEKGGEYRYYIANESDLRNDSIENWLLSTYNVSNSLACSRSIRNRILLEEVPSGQEYLEPIIEAMKQNRFVHITYYNYLRNDERQHYVMPLCVKLFRQRWYVVGRAWKSEFTCVFCLDRIKNFRLSSHTFEYPQDFSPEDYFEGCYGIIAGDGTEVERVVLKVSSGQANYIRDLRLHESQRETERNADYSIFEMRLRPTFDFQQELLWNGEGLEVLEPLWLRKEIAGIAKRMWNKYK